MSDEAARRAEEAWDQRYKHGKAGREWDAVANERPDRNEVSIILARWMYAYEAADADAERRFRALAAQSVGADSAKPLRPASQDTTETEGVKDR